jgi:hypothetical protein
MRPDCPELLKLCRDLLDKAYGYDRRSEPSEDSSTTDSTEDSAESIESLLSSSHSPSLSGKVLSSVKLPLKLTNQIGALDLTCYAQVPASRGFYGIPSLVAVGNSYVCYRLTETQTTWVTGQIQYIFDHDQTTKMAIRHSKPFVGPSDPFAQFVLEGFDARTVSSTFSTKYDIVPIAWIIGHAARWELDPEFVGVLSLSRVSCFLSV